MTTTAWLQTAVLILALAIACPLLGHYLAKVFGDDELAPGERVFGPIDRALYRIGGVDPDQEQTWSVYAISVLAFSVVSVLALYLLQRVQGILPFNPDGFGGVAPATAFNTATSFLTNTNWQSYSGESTMSHLTQMGGLAVQNFVSAAVGLAVAVALIRGLTRRGSATLGNFWVDLTRSITRVLLPLSILGGLVLVSQGAIQNLSGQTTIRTLTGSVQHIPGGPTASQEVIKELGTNGGGFFNANSAHPFESPNGFTNVFEAFLILVIPFALAFAYGRMTKDRKQGHAVAAAMFALWIASALLAMHFETTGNTRIDDRQVDQVATSVQAGGNAEGKEVRFGPAGTGLFTAASTGTSTGAVSGMHDSFTPAGGAVPLVNMMLGEVSPGGVGAGLYGMLMFALLAVFIAGLMVGRTPEYLGKKIQAAEMKLVTLFIVTVPVVILGFSAISVLMGSSKSSILNPGPHGLTEVVYGYTSAANNNGSAFGGLNAATNWYNTTTGLAMLCGRFLLIVPVLAIAGSLARKHPSPPSAGTFPTNTPLFAGLLVGVILIVVGLTFFPVVALGPLVEQLGS